MGRRRVERRPARSYPISCSYRMSPYAHPNRFCVRLYLTRRIYPAASSGVDDLRVCNVHGRSMQILCIALSASSLSGLQINRRGPIHHVVRVLFFFSRLKNQNRDSKIVLLLCVHADDAGRGGRPRAVAKLYSFSSNVLGSSRIDQLPTCQ
jgi:hypothetical protein